MKQIVFASCLAIFASLGLAGCNRGSKMEEHKYSGGDETMGQPRGSERVTVCTCG